MVIEIRPRFPVSFAAGQAFEIFLVKGWNKIIDWMFYPLKTHFKTQISSFIRKGSLRGDMIIEMEPSWMGLVPLQKKKRTSKSLLASSTMWGQEYGLLWQGTLRNVVWQPGWAGSLGEMDTCVYTAEFLCCPPVITTMLLNSYTPI